MELNELQKKMFSELKEKSYEIAGHVITAKEKALNLLNEWAGENGYDLDRVDDLFDNEDVLACCFDNESLMIIKNLLGG